MNTLQDFVIDAKAFIEGLRFGDAGMPEYSEHIQSVKQRFLENRETLEALASEDAPAFSEAAWAVLDMMRIAFNDILHLAKNPIVEASPIADDVAQTIEDIKEMTSSFTSSALSSIVSGETAELISELLDLFGLYEKLIVKQLALVYREEVPDYFGGLDTDAVFPSFRYSAANRCRMSSRELDPVSGAKVWNTPIGGLIWSSAVIDKNGDLYTGHADGEFVALKPDGEVKWRIHDEQMMYIDSTGVLGKDGFLYMASTDVDTRGHQNQGRIWKIDPATGNVLWQFWGRHFEDPETDPNAHLSSFYEGHITLNDEGGKIFIYAGSDDNRLYKLDTEGNLVWDYNCDKYPSAVIWTKPLLSPDGSTVFIGELSGRMHAVCTKTGRAKWVRQLGGSIVSSIAMGMYGELFAGCFDGKVYALAPEDGTVFWEYQTMGLIYSSPAIDTNGDLVIGSSDGGVYRLNRYGKKIWAYYTDAPVKSSAIIDSDGLIYIANQNGKLYCLSPEGRRVWSFDIDRPIEENDINSSPSIGPDGTIYFGATTGEVFAIPSNYFYENRDDERLDLNPAHDGEKPDIPPGGATLVFMDRNGTPCFDPPQDIAITDNLNLALFAVDDNMDVVPAELVPDCVDVMISPKIERTVKVESMGRYLYIVPEQFLDYDTEYTIKVNAKFQTGSSKKDFSATVKVKTAGRSRKTKLPVGISKTATDAFVIHGATITAPKEIDALGQAMADSLNFAVAPIYINEKENTIACAMCSAVDTGNGFEFAHLSVNKAVFGGKYKDTHVKVEGAIRLVAQGANIPFDRFQLCGQFTDEPGIEGLNFYSVAPISGVPDFEELIRVMRLSDTDDNCIGFATLATDPFDDAAAKKPAKADFEASENGGTVELKVTGSLKADDHWLNLTFIDKNTGEVIQYGQQEIDKDGRGNLTAISGRVPASAKKGAAVAVFTVDLYPVATVEL